MKNLKKKFSPTAKPTSGPPKACKFGSSANYMKLKPRKREKRCYEPPAGIYDPKKLPSPALHVDISDLGSIDRRAGTCPHELKGPAVDIVEFKCPVSAN